MQVKFSKLIITDTPIEMANFEQVIRMDTLTESEPVISHQLMPLKIPLVSILYGFHPGQELKGYELDLEVDFMTKADKIPRKQLEYKKTPNFLYKLYEIDSCLCYEKPITMVVTIKVSERLQAKELTTIEELASQLSKRTYIIYNDKSLVSYKRDLTIKEPFRTTHRYLSVSPAMGVIWLKCSNANEETVRLLSVRLMNWSIKTNEEVRLFESKSSFDQLSKEGMELKKEEDLAVMMTINSNLPKIEIPCVVQFCLSSMPGHIFKIIKYLNVE